MPEVSSLVSTFLAKAEPELQRRILIGNSDYSAFVNRWPSVKHTWDNLKPITINLTLANHDKTFQFFRDDRTTLVSSVSIDFLVGDDDGINWLKSSGEVHDNGFLDNDWAVSNANIVPYSSDFQTEFDPWGDRTHRRWIRGAGATSLSGLTQFWQANSADVQVADQDTTYNVSFYARAGAATYIAVNMNWESGFWIGPASVDSYQYAIFDVNTGQVLFQGDSVSNASIEDVGSNWYRCQADIDVASVSIATTGASLIPLRMYMSATSDFQAGDQSSGDYLFLAGPQITSGPDLRQVTLTDSGIAAYPGSGYPANGVSSYHAVNIFRGKISGVRYNRNIVTARVTDKVKQLSERVIGDVSSPVTYQSSDYLPGDLAWWAVTSYGGFDTTASAANVDIDYDSWATWSSVFSNSNIYMQAILGGETVTGFIRKLSRMTDSAIFMSNDRLTFFRFSTVSSLTTALNDDLITAARGVDVRIEDLDIINRQIVFADYDPTTREFGIVVNDENTASINSFGLREQIEKDEALWFVSSATAQDLAQRLVSVNNQPFDRINQETGLNGLVANIGFMTSVQDDSINLLDTFRVLEITVDMERGLVRLGSQSNQVQNAFILDITSMGGTEILT